MGPHGPAKCLLKVVEKLSERFTALEDQNARLSEELDHQDKLHAERQRTFLAAIEELEELTASLEQTITFLHRSQEGADTVVDSSPPSACAEGSSDSTLTWTSGLRLPPTVTIQGMLRYLDVDLLLALARPRATYTR